MLHHDLNQIESSSSGIYLRELQTDVRKTRQDKSLEREPWLASEYAAVIFEDEGGVAAYALYREQSEEIYLRQLFVMRDRRRKGIGRMAMEILRSEILPKNKRLTVEVLTQNTGAVAFWRAMGYKDYSLQLEILP